MLIFVVKEIQRYLFIKTNNTIYSWFNINKKPFSFILFVATIALPLQKGILKRMFNNIIYINRIKSFK